MVVQEVAVMEVMLRSQTIDVPPVVLVLVVILVMVLPQAIVVHWHRVAVERRVIMGCILLLAGYLVVVVALVL